MSKTVTSVLALVAGLSIAGAALAQASGGPDAKGNAPLKRAHTVNDGSAKRGSTSFTEKQAREHIEKSGFASVTNMVKGDDGVWRGQAMRGGATVDVAMDFKGNVSTPRAAASSPPPVAPPASASSTTSMTHERATTTDRTTPGVVTSARHRHHHRSHSTANCANPAPNGAACSGIDRNHNGVSDKEDRAIKAGAHP